MNFKKCLALILSASMTLSGMVLPSVASAAGDYGTVTTNSDGSKTLTFGANSITQSGSDVLPYLDTSLSFEERAADLVSRMTLEEKVSQIGYKAAAIDRLGVKAYDY